MDYIEKSKRAFFETNTVFFVSKYTEVVGVCLCGRGKKIIQINGVCVEEVVYIKEGKSLIFYAL
jgi:hypothetical protein